MRRGGLILAGLLALAVLEVWLLVWLAHGIGLGWTLMILIVSAVVGVLLFRREGVRTFVSLAQAPPEPEQIGQRVTDTFLVMVGGLLFFLPGLITDFLGLFCLLPPARRLARRGVQALLGAWAKPYRDRADLMDLRLRPDTVVEGQAVDDSPPAAGREGRTRPGPDDPTVIRGEIEP